MSHSFLPSTIKFISILYRQLQFSSSAALFDASFTEENLNTLKTTSNLQHVGLVTPPSRPLTVRLVLPSSQSRPLLQLSWNTVIHYASITLSQTFDRLDSGKYALDRMYDVQDSLVDQPSNYPPFQPVTNTDQSNPNMFLLDYSRSFASTCPRTMQLD